MTGACRRYQVVIMGSAKCGKTSIIHNYMFGKSNKPYKETVEDLYIQGHTFNGRRIFIDFLDTAGSIQFPSMQELYIRRARGFILVYSITDQRSFNFMKQLWNRIKLVRENILKIPCIIIGNFLDKEELREIERFDLLSWCYSENLGGCAIELSGKEGTGIHSIFNTLLQQFGTRRTTQYISKRQMIISKDGTNENRKNKKFQTEKNVREVKVNVGSQHICYNEIVFDLDKDVCGLRTVRTSTNPNRPGQQKEKSKKCAGKSNKSVTDGNNAGKFSFKLIRGITSLFKIR